MIQKLQQLEGEQGAAAAAHGAALRQRVGQSEPDSVATPQSEAEASNRAQTAGRVQGNNRRGQGNVRNSESGTDGERDLSAGKPAAGGTSQATSAAGQAPGSATAGTPRPAAGAPGQTAAPGQAARINQAPGAVAQMHSEHVPHQLVAVLDQAADTELQMTKEMLQKFEGQDFEMGYLGQQIVAHTCMLAELQALKNAGPEELQQLVTEGEQVTREHLEQAMKLSHQLSDKEGNDRDVNPRSANATGKKPSNAQRENK
jgi:hypothetical protein